MFNPQVCPHVTFKLKAAQLFREAKKQSAKATENHLEAAKQDSNLFSEKFAATSAKR